MKDRIITILKNNKVVIQNFSYLSILQVFSLLLPLLSYPYLIRVVGAELYGEVILAQAVISYFVILINFGFNTSATRDISINRDNKMKLSEIISSILFVKFLLWLFSLCVLFILFFFIESLNENRLLYLFSFGVTLNELLFPIWYFQGIEKMRYITIINVVSKIIFTILIFILIKSSNDYIYIPLLNTFGIIISCLFALYIVFIKHKIRLVRVSLVQISEQVRESIAFFFSDSLRVIWEQTTVILIASILNTASVAYYNLGIKIVDLVCSIFYNFSNAIFPSLAVNINKARIKKMLFFETIAVVLCLLTLLLLIDPIILFLGGSEMIYSKYYFFLLCPLIILKPMTAFSSVICVSLKKNRIVYLTVLIGFFVYVSINVVSKLLGVINKEIIALSLSMAYFIYLSVRLLVIKRTLKNHE